MSSLGIEINGRYAPTKKAVKEAVKDHPDRIYLTDFSMFATKPKTGYLSDLPDGRYDFVGPDPERDRKFYGSITKKGDVLKVS